MSNIRVGVLRGGPSDEYDISLKSGGTILKHMPEAYEPHDIYISRDGTWHRDGLPRDPTRALQGIDVAVNALRGRYGEDGKVQKILDELSIPYTGSGPTASYMAMNKALAKNAFIQNGIKTPYYIVVKKDDDLEDKYNHIFHHFYLPIVIKPATSGSSIGMTLVKDFRYVTDAIQNALSHSDSVIVEEYIRGREATAGVIEDFRDQKLYTLLPVEIVHPKGHDFYTTEVKRDGMANEISPGNFSFEEKKEIQRLAKLAHEALGLRHYSRTDMIVTPRRGVYVLEINSQPELTPTSTMHKSFEAIGLTLKNFLDHIIKLGLKY
jgi:D-alanine-D-alanine ligase